MPATAATTIARISKSLNSFFIRFLPVRPRAGKSPCKTLRRGIPKVPPIRSGLEFPRPSGDPAGEIALRPGGFRQLFERDADRAEPGFRALAGAALLELEEARLLEGVGHQGLAIGERRIRSGERRLEPGSGLVVFDFWQEKLHFPNPSLAPVFRERDESGRRRQLLVFLRVPLL